MIAKIRELCLAKREELRKQVCIDELDELLFNLRYIQSVSLKNIEAPANERTIRRRFEKMNKRIKNIPTKILMAIFG